MGILNITPDSFSDGGDFLGLDAAMRRTEEMLREGAVIIDVGGESTRPRGVTYGEGADRIDADEERARVTPIIQGIVSQFPEAIVSVDTYKPEVARDAMETGAHIINDITGLRLSGDMAIVAARYGAPLIVMHSVGRPGSIPHEYHYEDVVSEVKFSLTQAVQKAEKAGVRHIITDPGFGFGKTPEENLRLIAGTQAFLKIGRPVLLGVSRKSTIGKLLGSEEHPAPVKERLFGTLGSTAAAVMLGVSMIRTHDVAPTVEMLKVLEATIDSKNK